MPVTTSQTALMAGYLELRREAERASVDAPTSRDALVRGDRRAEARHQAAERTAWGDVQVL